MSPMANMPFYKQFVTWGFFPTSETNTYVSMSEFHLDRIIFSVSRQVYSIHVYIQKS